MIGQLIRRFHMPPDCREVARFLQAYLDGELPPSEFARVGEHLEQCERCGIEADVYHEVKRSLAQLAVPADHAAVDRLQTFAAQLAPESGP